MFPAGKYYVGDLCYVLNDSWDEACDLFISGHSVLDGEFAFKDGRKFASYTTRWGDGCYEDENGREYSVDAGLIGVISINDIDVDLRDQAHEVGPRFGGQIVEFKAPFDTYSHSGTIVIGDIKIDTDPSYDDMEDYDGEGDEY